MKQMQFQNLKNHNYHLHWWHQISMSYGNVEEKPRVISRLSNNRGKKIDAFGSHAKIVDSALV